MPTSRITSGGDERPNRPRAGGGEDALETLGCWIRLALLFVGAGLVVSGCDELGILFRSNPDPVPVSLADLEGGAPLPDHYLLIGEHLSDFRHELVTYLKAQGGKEPGARTPVLAVYYPIVSLEHPYARGESKTPVPFAVLVCDKSFERYGDLPDVPQVEHRLRGVVVTEVVRFTDEREAKLAELFPGADLEKIVVVERNRAPRPLSANLGRLGLGVGLLLLGFFGPFLLRQVRRPFRPSPTPPENETVEGEPSS